MSTAAPPQTDSSVSESLTPRRRSFRHCPPVASPLPWQSVLNAIARVSRRRDTRGELCAYLERRFAASDVLLFSSGTHALTAALTAALAHASTRIVALPGFACFDLASAAIGAGADVVLYDIDPTTLAPDWASFDDALAAGASAAVVAPLFGIPVDWDRASAIAGIRGAMLIEDAAQAAGGAWMGRPMGSLGEASVLSFGRGKGWTGSGGGALLLRSVSASRSGDARARGRIARIARASDSAVADANVRDSVTAFLNACAQMLLSHPAVYGIPAALPFLHLGETRFKPPTPQRRISGFSAALALATADPSHAARRIRVRTAGAYKEHIGELSGLTTFDTAVDANSDAGWLRYPVLASPALRGSLLRAFASDGVTTSYPIPLRSLGQLQSRLARAAHTPGADRLAAELLTLPTHAHAAANLPGRISAFISQSQV